MTATVGYAEDVETWTGARLAGGDWITVVSTPSGLEVVRWRRLDSAPGDPARPTVVHGGRTYELRERGRARYDAHGDVDLPGCGDVDYADFVDGDRRLSFEDYDGTGWEASAGRLLPPGSVAIRR